MAFKIKDSLIVKLPKEWDLGTGGLGDPGTFATSPGPGPHPPGVPHSQAPWIDPVDRAELRMLLQLVLTRLGGPLTLGEMQPRSTADLEDLESRLNAALEEVRGFRSRQKGK